MKITLHTKQLLISIIIIYGLSIFQFYKDYSTYKTLTRKGVLTKTEAEFIPKELDSDYYRFSFKTTDGQIITKTGKCIDKERFKDFYSDLKVIYDPDNPNIYIEKPYYDNYSLGYKIFFYFALYGVVGTLITYGFVRVLYLFSDKEFRLKMKKNIAQHG